MVYALLILSCSRSPTSPATAGTPSTSAPATASPAAPATAQPAPEPPPLSLVQSGVLTGPCEASGVAWFQDRWLVADNEIPDRLFRYDRALKPDGELRLEATVEDIEALTTDGAGPGSSLWVVGSFSRKKGGAEAPERSRVLKVGSGLLPELPWPGTMDPEARNVEGAAIRDGGLWLGLRRPEVGILSPAEGLREVYRDGRRAIRDLIWQDGRWVMILSADGMPSLLVSEGPKGEAPRTLAALSEDAEGLAAHPDGGYLVVEDGGWNEDKTACKPGKEARWGWWK